MITPVTNPALSPPGDTSVMCKEVQPSWLRATTGWVRRGLSHRGSRRVLVPLPLCRARAGRDGFCSHFSRNSPNAGATPGGCGERGRLESETLCQLKMQPGCGRAHCSNSSAANPITPLILMHHHMGLGQNPTILGKALLKIPLISAAWFTQIP